MFMKIDILTLFPEMFAGPFSESIIKRAQEKKLINLNIHNLRDWAEDKHKVVDNPPYGGGPGMVMRVDVIDRAVTALKKTQKLKNSKTQKIRTLNTEHRTRVVLLSAKGEKYTQLKAQRLSKFDHLILICGHYEGVDHRVHEHVADEVISIGDYVLSGGEIPAMVVTDSIVRLIPGVLGNPDSLSDESFSNSQLSTLNSQLSTEHPQYTRPQQYKGWKVPEVLLSGNHKEIEKWRKKNSK